MSFFWPEPIPPEPPLTPKPFIVPPSSSDLLHTKKRKCANRIKAKVSNFSVNNANVNKWSNNKFVKTLFYLYLFKKYKSDCIYIIDNGRFHESGLYMYKEDMYKKENEKNYREFSLHLINCIKRGEQVIIIPVCLSFGGSAHANVLIYRRKDNVLEHFEPHGSKFNGHNGDENRAFIKKEMMAFVDEFNGHLKQANFPEVRMVEPNVVCPYARGLQSLEGSVQNTKYEIVGYCLAWSMFFSELALANPSLSSNEILEIVIKNPEGLHTGQYLKNVIEGYADHVSDKIDKYYSIIFNQIMTTVEIQCRMDAATIGERRRMNSEFATIINIEMELIMKKISITEKMDKLKAIKKKTTDILHHIEILEKMKILDSLSTPIGSFGSSFVISPFPPRKIASPKIVLKICPDGYFLNTKTNRCNKNKKGKNVTPKKCPEGQHLNVLTNRCIKDLKEPEKPKNVTLKKCPEGQHLNVLTNRCNKDKPPKVCPEGQHLNVVTNRCNKDKK